MCRLRIAISASTAALCALTSATGAWTSAAASCSDPHFSSSASMLASSLACCRGRYLSLISRRNEQPRGPWCTPSTASTSIRIAVWPALGPL
eukprot:scaffold9353_cov31-Tisochrysis_lutea.AAC.2